MAKILTVIPVRSGSKGVPGKNIRLLNGAPLVSYAIRTALASKHPQRVVVSTDSEEIAAVAREAGAEVPFLRPKELGEDHVPIPPVVLHALDVLDDPDDPFDIVASLHATSPLLTTETLDKGIDMLLRDPSFDSAASLTLINKGHPFRAYGLAEDDELTPFTEYTSEKYLQKQDRPPAYCMTGGLVIRRPAVLRAENAKGFALGKRCGGIVVSQEEAADIDTEVDFVVCDTLMRMRQA